MGKRELVDLLNLSSLCLVMVEWLFLAVPWGCLRFVIVVFPDHTHFLFLKTKLRMSHSGSSQNQASGTNRPMKASHQDSQRVLN